MMDSRHHIIKVIHTVNELVICTISIMNFKARVLSWSDEVRSTRWESFIKSVFLIAFIL